MATIPSGTKFIGLPSTYPTAEKRSAQVNAESGVYTMQDVTDTVRPYKVFTALLTQMGGNNLQSLLSQDTPSLTIGVTYQIVDDGGFGWDFTNVGAPNNDLNTSFIATGTTPASWGTNAMLQYNTGAPVANVLENTIGNVFCVFNADGVYGVESDDLFTDLKTFVTSGDLSDCCSDDVFGKIIFNFNSSNRCGILTFNESNVLIYNQLVNTPIEIRVYN